jgi:hypothetical protein
MSNPAFIFSKDLIYPPLLPLLISVGSIFPQPDIAYRWIILLFSILGITAIYQLGRTVFFILLGQNILKINKSGGELADYAVAGICFLICLLKWSSFLAILWVIIYYLYGLKNIPLASRIKKAAVPVTLATTAWICWI